MPALLSLEHDLLLFSFSAQCFIVTEQIHLLGNCIYFRILLINDAIGPQGDPADQKTRVGDPVIQSQNCIRDQFGGGCVSAKVGCPVGVLGDLASVMVGGDRTVVSVGPCRVSQIFDIVTDAWPFPM